MALGLDEVSFGVTVRIAIQFDEGFHHLELQFKVRVRRGVRGGVRYSQEKSGSIFHIK